MLRPPPEQKDIPAPKSLETRCMEEFKKDEYFRKLNDKFGMSIQPELWARFFKIQPAADLRCRPS